MKIDEAKEYAEIIIQLLDDPHPGLFTWQSMFREAVQNLGEGIGMVLPDPSEIDRHDS